MDAHAEYDGPVIELYIGMSWDAQTHRIYTKPPVGWSKMTSEERDKFLQTEAEMWADEQLEIGGVAFDNVETAERETRQYWGGGFSRYDIDDLFGYVSDESEDE